MPSIEEAVPGTDLAAPIGGTWTPAFCPTLGKARELRPSAPPLQQMLLSLTSFTWLIRSMNSDQQWAQKRPIVPAGILATPRAIQQTEIV